MYSVSQESQFSNYHLTHPIKLALNSLCYRIQCRMRIRMRMVTPGFDGYAELRIKANRTVLCLAILKQIHPMHYAPMCPVPQK